MQGEFVALVDRLRLTSEQFKAVAFLAEFTKGMVVFAFPGYKTPAGASELVNEVYRVSDELISGTLKSGTKLACKTGCFWCCYMRVKATPLEILGIVDFLRSHLSARELSELRQRLVTADEITRGMDGYQRVCTKTACPLLVDDECSAYPVRPIACRVYHSLNLSDCEVPLDDKERNVTVRNDISGLGMGIFAGLTEGLRAVGLQTRLVELIAGLRVVMDEPEVETRWLAGEPAFEEAEIANAKEIESIHRAFLEELVEPRSEPSGKGLGMET